MLRREHHVGRAEERVGAGGVDAEHVVAGLAAGSRLSARAVFQVSNSSGDGLPSAPAAPMKKSTSAPVLRPIQFRCSVLMPFGPVEPFEVVLQPVGVGGDPQHPLPQRHADDGMAAAFALAVDHFFVGQHRAQRRAPVHRRVELDRPGDARPDSGGRRLRPAACTSAGIGSSAIGRPFCCSASNQVSKSTQEDPLRPAEVLDVGRGQLAVPVVAEAEHLELPAERGDVLLGVSSAGACRS